MQVRAFRAAPQALAELPLPAIVHWEGEHFVVLERASRRTIRIIDPAIGRRHLRWEELSDAMSGLVLTFEPGPGFVAPRPDHRGRTRHWIRELRGHLHGTRAQLVNVLAISFAVQVLAIAGPVASAVIIGSVTGDGSGGMLSLLPAFISALALAQFAASRARLTVLVRLEELLNARLATHVVGHLLSLPLTFFEERGSADLRQRVASTFEIREALTAQTVEALLDAVLMIVYLAILIVYDVQYGLLVLAIGSAQVGLVIASSARARRLHHRQLLAESKTQTVLAQMLDGIVTIKASGSEERMLARWRERLVRELALKRSHDRFTGTMRMRPRACERLHR
jgi:ATP-binding cassette subfamily B protein